MKVMGILNVTPDSFSDGGKYDRIDKAVAHARQMVADGASIVDVGGESTRPGARKISSQEELERVIPVIRALKRVLDVPISIDTYKAEVARFAVEAGASIVNDVGGAKLDPQMAKVMAQTGAEVILMHHGTHEKEGAMQNLQQELVADLRASIDLVVSAGVDPKKITVDPGIGFGKTMVQNTEILKNIDVYRQLLGFPLLLGASKKRLVRHLMVGDQDQDADAQMLGIGTIATTCYAYGKGVDIVRVHDVKANVCAINVMKNLGVDPYDL